MKAIRVHEFGGPEVLRPEDLPLPEPGPGQIRLKVHASGVNFIDIYQRTGQYRGELPFTLGQEAAGTVDAVGAGVTDFRPGDRAGFTSAQGSYAEYVVVPASLAVNVPAGVDFEQAAAVLLQGYTAHYLTHSTYALRAGETALVHAAAGGLGLLVVQMAKRLGARVIGTVSTEAKARLAREMGADEVILYSQQDFEAETKRLTEGRGVEVVYDSVGRTTFEHSLNCLRRRGMLVLCGQSSGAVAPLDPQVLNAKGSLYLTRPTLMHYIMDRPELLRRAADIFGWLAAGELKVRVDRRYPLSAAAEAQRHLESRQVMGKIVLLSAPG